MEWGGGGRTVRTGVWRRAMPTALYAPHAPETTGRADTRATGGGCGWERVSTAGGAARRLPSRRVQVGAGDAVKSRGPKTRKNRQANFKCGAVVLIMHRYSSEMDPVPANGRFRDPLDTLSRPHSPRAAAPPVTCAPLAPASPSTATAPHPTPTSPVLAGPPLLVVFAPLLSCTRTSVTCSTAAC